MATSLGNSVAPVVLIVRPTVEHDPDHADCLRIRIDLQDLERRIKETKRNLPGVKLEIVLRPTPPPKETLCLYNVPTYFR